MNKTQMLSKVQGAFMGGCIGDALGMPVETWSHEDIVGINGVSGFMDSVQRKVRDTANLKAGDTTDDWQLTRAVARSLIRTKGSFDVHDCAKEHVRELNQSTFGWGKTTRIALEEIRDGKRNLDLPPRDLGPGKGCGNGIIMKIAPLALAFTLKGTSESLLDLCLKLGRITHPDPRAGVAAYAVAGCINYVAKAKLDRENSVNELLEKALAAIKRAEQKTGIVADTISERIERLRGCLNDGDKLRVVANPGFHALETAAFTIGTFLRHPNDFRTGVLEAVNAGGDTDTNASIVGALIGTHCGLESIPAEWRTFRPHFDEALTLGQEFVEAIL